MIRRRSKMVPFLDARRVEIGAAVGDEMDAVEHGLEGEAVVVTVSAASALPDRRAVDEYVITAVAHDEIARVGENGGLWLA